MTRRRTRPLCSMFLLLLAVNFMFAQEPLPGAEPVNTKTIDLQQNGNSITGHFKGPDQSGGLQGSVNGHHIVFRTKTRHPLTFRGQVEGDTMSGTYHVMGKEGEFHAERTGAK